MHGNTSGRGEKIFLKLKNLLTKYVNRFIIISAYQKGVLIMKKDPASFAAWLSGRMRRYDV